MQESTASNTNFYSTNNSQNMSIERLNAKVDFLREQSKLMDERFSRVNEEIGELRSMIIAKEREIKELEGKAIKAYDLVSEVQPEQFSEMINKTNLKIDSLKEKQNSFDNIQHKIMEEIKDMKNKIFAFRGVEQTLELNDEVKLELENIKRIENNIEKHSDKVETIFIKSQKNVADFERLREIINRLEDNLHTLEKDFVKVKINFSKGEYKGVGKKSYAAIEENIEAIKDIDEYKHKVDDVITKLENLRINKSIDEEQEEKEINREIKELEREEEIIEEESKDIEINLKKMRSLISSSFRDIKDKKRVSAKKKYVEINEMYNSLDSEGKKSVYPKISKLYSEIKNSKINKK